jgi:hypothetical protein
MVDPILKSSEKMYKILFHWTFFVLYRKMQGKARQGKARQGKAGQGRAGQGRAGQGRAGQGLQCPKHNDTGY